MSRPRLPFPRLVLLLAGLGLAAPPLLSAAAESSPPHTWQWETECSDPADTGLHRQRGTVDVAPYRGDSPLYRRGFPQVSDNRRHLHDFFSAIAWWQLEPAHDLIRNQPADMIRRRVLARIPGRDLAVAYLPDSEDIEIDVSGFSATLAARWFDPVRNRTTPVAGTVRNQGTHRFAPPGEGDWVLVLARAK